jgi:hypothetical protein
MYVNVNFFSDDLDELGRNLDLMRAQWSLAPYALWSCSGSMLRLDFASGPEAHGLVRVNAEMLPRSFVEKMAEADWIWERPRNDQGVRFTESVFGKGTATRAFESKTGAVEAMKALSAPAAVLSLMRRVKVSKAVEWIDELTPEGDGETVFNVRIVEKEKHAISEWSVSFDGVDFNVKLDVSAPSGNRHGYANVDNSPVYKLTVTFDVNARRRLLLTFLEARGITSMCGSYEITNRY